MTDPSGGGRAPAGGFIVPDPERGTVVTVGTFDGVHRGHWEVLQEIGRRARAQDRRAVLLTFDPHPLRIVKPERAPPLLTTPDEKKEILAESGLDYAVFLRFTPELSRYSPERFVREILLGRLAVRELVIGYDHGFGKGRSGDAETLRRLGREEGFRVDVVPPVPMGPEPVSSTRIRKAVEAGEMEQAAQGLGRPYSVRGVVVRGDGRGRELGFPTANLRVANAEKLLPPPGIYAVHGVLKDRTIPGALHLGPRPTFRGSASTVELHLIDFDAELYGAEVKVNFVQYLRPVLPFDSPEALIHQMRDDVERARNILGAKDEGGRS